MNLHENQAGGGAEQVAGMIAVLSHIDTAGFHGIDTALSSSSAEIDESWSGHVRNAWIAVAANDWPAPLQPLAKAFTDATAALTAALDRDDREAALAPARDSHVAQHRLSSAGWAYLAQRAGIQGEGDTHSHPHPRHP